MTEPLPARKTSPLAVASFVLGTLGLACLGLLTGLPAIICGHMARKKIRLSPVPVDGSGLALAGLILGYLSFLTTISIIGIFASLAIPAIQGAKIKNVATMQLGNARQFNLSIQMMAIDGVAKNNPSLGYPADTGVTTKAQLKERLIQGDYLFAGDFEKLGYDNFLIGNVSETDPPETIVVRSKPTNEKFTIIMCKNGSGYILRPGQPIVGTDPPREPPYLAP